MLFDQRSLLSSLLPAEMPLQTDVTKKISLSIELPLRELSSWDEQGISLSHSVASYLLLRLRPGHCGQRMEALFFLLVLSHGLEALSWVEHAEDTGPPFVIAPVWEVVVLCEVKQAERNSGSA